MAATSVGDPSCRTPDSKSSVLPLERTVRVPLISPQRLSIRSSAVQSEFRVVVATVSRPIGVTVSTVAQPESKASPVSRTNQTATLRAELPDTGAKRFVTALNALFRAWGPRLGQ